MVVVVIPARAEYPGEATSLAPVVVLFYHFNLLVVESLPHTGATLIRYIIVMPNATQQRNRCLFGADVL